MKHFQIICLLILLFSYNTYAQKADKNAAERLKIAEAVKNGTTYIIVSDVNFPDHEKYLAEIKKRWPYAKDVQYITAHNGKFDSPVSAGDSFIDLVRNTTTGNFAFGRGLAYTSNTINFWMLTDKFSENNDPFAQSSYHLIAGTSFDIYYLSTLSFDLDKTIFFHFDGYPGSILNIMQQLAFYYLAQDPDKVSLNDPQQLKTLSKDTLYIPEFVFFRGKERLTRQLNEKQANNLLKDYPLPYKILSCADFEKKIILSPTPFYYLSHFENRTFIINSKNGSSIYWAEANSDLDEKDFKKIVKVINK